MQKVEDDKEVSEIKKLMEIIPNEEEVAIDVIPLAVKSLSIVDWKIQKERRKSYYQIMRADGKSQMYIVFSHMLKSFDREDLENLYKLACSFMLYDLDFEPLSLSLSSLPSCDLMSLTNMLILLHYLESFKSELAEVFVFKS
ncbi:hypothetical protein Tco_0440054 [Tanacetum coccineum]